MEGVGGALHIQIPKGYHHAESPDGMSYKLQRAPIYKVVHISSYGVPYKFLRFVHQFLEGLH